MKLLLALITLFSFKTSFAAEPTMASSMIVGGTTYAAGHAVLMVAAVSTMMPIMTTLDLRGEGFKIVMNAKDDAAMMVATNGEFNTAALQQAFRVIRELAPTLKFDDLNLATAILAL